MVEKNHPRAPIRQVERIHSEQFAKWFSNHVKHFHLPKDDPICRDLRLLADGPDIIGVTYEIYVVNGFRFHTRELEHTRKTQNCGVSVKATTSSFSSTRDENPILSELDYYGVPTDIIALHYVDREVVLFGCDWVSKGKRLKQDMDGFTLANFSNIRRQEEPFILSSKATHVFYVADPVDTNWHIVLSTIAKDAYSMEPLADVETYLQSNFCSPAIQNDIEEFNWICEDVEGVEVDICA